MKKLTQAQQVHSMKKIFTICLIMIFLLTASPVLAVNTYSIAFGNETTQSVSRADGGGGDPLDITGDMTVMFWYKPTAQPGGGLLSILARKNDAWYIAYSSSDELNWYMWGGSPAETGYNIENLLTNNIWYHIMAVYDASATKIEFFVNCSSIGSDSSQSNSIDDSSGSFEISTANSDYGAHGREDDFRLYDGTRDATDCLSDYQAELDGDETDLVAYWKFENDATDSTQVGTGCEGACDLTENNTPTYPTDPAFDDSPPVVILPRRQSEIFF